MNFKMKKFSQNQIYRKKGINDKGSESKKEYKWKEEEKIEDREGKREKDWQER